jgi:transmembrane sensor
MNPRQQTEARSVAEQAAEWLLVLEDAGPEARAAFTDWIAQSPLHVVAFLRAATMDSLLSRIDPQRSVKIERGAMGEEAANVTALAGRKSHLPEARRRGRSGPLIAAAASVALIVTIGVVWLQTKHPSRWTHYSTAVGEQRVFELDDGSVLHMNTGSTVDVLFTDRERHIKLQAGEAMFRVQRDPLRPFRVYSAESVIQALGTQFNVNRTRDGAVVSVIEGVVEVSHDRTLVDALTAPAQRTPQGVRQPVRLTAGEQVRIARNGALAAPTKADVSRVSAWRQRRLIFIDEPLASIAEEFNRYNRTPKIRLEGSAVGERRYAAAFDADDPESLLTILGKDSGLRVERREDEIIVRQRTANPQ